jgi:hypothetical protein
MKELIAVRQTEEETLLFILNDIVRISYQSDKPQEVLDIFNEVKQSLPVGYEYLTDAVLTHLLWAKGCTRRFEKHIQEEFFNNLDKYLSGAVNVQVKMNCLHMPDGFVKYKGNLIPVEVKIDAIVHSSIRQINRYIKEYSSSGGIVVAPKLSAPLPSNVIFVEVK